MKEINFSSFPDVDEVRAPIPQKQETLISAGYEGDSMNNRQNYRKARTRTVFDGFRNFGNEASSKFDWHYFLKPFCKLDMLESF